CVGPRDRRSTGIRAIRRGSCAEVAYRERRMSKVGTVLIVLGLASAAGAYLMTWDSLFDRPEAFSAHLGIVKTCRAPDAAAIGVALEGWRSFARTAGRASRPGEQAPTSWSPRKSEASVAPPSAPSQAWDRVSLTRELQRELKRVGCYDGEVSGVWS